MKKSKVSKKHQGDVQMISIDAIPAGATPVEKQPVAFGEHSGHQHILTGDYTMFKDEKNEFFATIGEKGAKMQHIHESQFTSFDTLDEIAKADHKPVTLEPGKSYSFGIHKKFNPYAKVFEKVQD